MQKREQGAKKKTKKLIELYIQEKAKERQALNKEIANLDQLHRKVKQIDKETYERLKNVLITMNDKKSKDANDLYTFVTKKK